MKSLHYLVLLASCWLLLNSCSPTYGPATVGTDMPYMAKPWLDSTETAENYASLRVANGIRYLSDDRNYYTEASLHRSNVYQRFYLSYGIFGSLGSYNVKPGDYWGDADRVEFAKKYQHANAGIRLSGGYRSRLGKNLDVETGLYLSRGFEFGEFKQFRADAIASGNAASLSISDNSTFSFLWTFGLSARLGESVFGGLHSGYGFSNEVGVAPIGLWLQVNRVVVNGTLFTLSNLSDISSGNGITNNSYTAFQVSVSYALSKQKQ